MLRLKNQVCYETPPFIPLSHRTPTLSYSYSCQMIIYIYIYVCIYINPLLRLGILPVDIALRRNELAKRPMMTGIEM